jgi:hypothetical protein
MTLKQQFQFLKKLSNKMSKAEENQSAQIGHRIETAGTDPLVNPILVDINGKDIGSKDLKVELSSEQLNLQADTIQLVSVYELALLADKIKSVTLEEPLLKRLGNLNDLTKWFKTSPDNLKTKIENQTQPLTEIHDALDRPLNLKESFKVWLDDDLDDREAPEGWNHFTGLREVCLLLRNGQVKEVSLDNDLGDDDIYGQGTRVIDFLDAEMYSGRNFWPEKITIHSANPYARDRAIKAIESCNRRHNLNFKIGYTPSGSKPLFSRV